MSSVGLQLARASSHNYHFQCQDQQESLVIALTLRIAVYLQTLDNKLNHCRSSTNMQRKLSCPSIVLLHDEVESRLKSSQGMHLTQRSL